MTNTTKQPPVEKLFDGSLTIAIWRNEAQDGKIRYSAEPSRSYQDAQGNWHTTTSFSATELLQLSHLATRAYDRMAELRAADRAKTGT